MKRILRWMILLSLLAPLGPAPQAAGNAKLDRILRKLDIWNSGLKTFQADIIQRKFLRILQEFDEPEKGKICFKKTPQGIFLKKEIEEPGKTIMLVTPREIVVFYPKKNQALRRGITEHQARYANFGIGTSAEDLKRNFEITFVNDEVIKNRIFHVISMNPTNPSIANYFKTLCLWIDSETGVPVRQRIEEHNGDYTDIQFFDIQLNKKVKDKTFELKLPKNVEFIS
jgi:outer membrane lipoprotein-sorting protein